MDEPPPPIVLSVPRSITAQERREKRSKWKAVNGSSSSGNGETSGGTSYTKNRSGYTVPTVMNGGIADDTFADLLKRNEDELLAFVAQVNHVYQEN